MTGAHIGHRHQAQHVCGAGAVVPLRAVHHQLDGLVQGVAPGVQPCVLSIPRRKPGVGVEEDEVPALVPLPPGQGCDRIIHLPQEQPGLGAEVGAGRRRVQDSGFRV